MADASQRTLAWREQKRRDGYQPLTIWLPAAVKHAMEDLAYQRHQDLSALLVEAFQAWHPDAALERPRAGELKRLIDEAVARALQRAPAVPVSPPPRLKRKKTGGKLGIPPETLQAICAERRKYPNLSLLKLSRHLYETGLYRSTSQHGEVKPVNPGTLKVWLDNAKATGLLEPSP